MVALRCVDIVHPPRASHNVIPVNISEVATPGNKKLIGAVIRKQEGGHMVPKSVLLAILGKIQLTVHSTR